MRNRSAGNRALDNYFLVYFMCVGHNVSAIYVQLIYTKHIAAGLISIFTFCKFEGILLEKISSH